MQLLKKNYEIAIIDIQILLISVMTSQRLKNNIGIIGDGMGIN